MTTSLMPMDPALSPQQVTRLLPIRADLLPDEIISRRRANRMRTTVLAALVLVIVALGGWSAVVYRDNIAAQHDRDAVKGQIDHVNNTMTDAKHSEITRTINQNKAISNELKTLMANDLRWSALLNKLRAAGKASNVSLGRITASLAGASSSAAAGPVGSGAAATLTLEGSAKDKKTIAGFIQKLADVPDISNPYLTTATQNSGKNSNFAFTINADVNSGALCGRFTTPCPAGGN